MKYNLEYRIKFLKEELAELETAYNNSDLAEVIDALIDLCYVSIGTGILMGVNWDKHWAEVQRANMEKIRVTSSTDSKRGHSFDVKKPTFWVPPQHTSILRGEL